VDPDDHGIRQPCVAGGDHPGHWLVADQQGHAKLGGLLALRNADLALQGFISSLANIMLKVLLIVSVASMIGVETTSFVAAIGAAGLAIGLALQGSLANFAGGVLILLFRPFRIGDWIEAQGAGTVDSIQIFHTVLRTGDNKTLSCPTAICRTASSPTPTVSRPARWCSTLGGLRSRPAESPSSLAGPGQGSACFDGPRAWRSFRPWVTVRSLFPCECGSKRQIIGT
jgi:hypothetical protein